MTRLMAYKISLRLAGGMFDLAATAKQAVEDGKDKSIKTVCCGPEDSVDPTTGVITVNRHDPVPPKQVVTCPTCGLFKSSFHGWPKAKDNEDGTFTMIPEALAAAKPGEEFTSLISVGLTDAGDVEAKTLPSGRFYYLEGGKDAAAKYTSVAGAIDAFAAQGLCYVTRYAVVSAVAMYRVITIAGVICLQELAMPENVRVRPGVDYPPAQQEQIELVMMASKMTYTAFEPASWTNDQQNAITAYLATASPTAAGAAGTPVMAAPKVADPFAALRALREQQIAAGDVVPKQALPSEVPANVSTALLDEKPAPKKRAPRKAKEKVSA